MDFKIPEGINGMIFDLDGTLADSMPIHMKAWQDACRSFGMDMSSKFLRSFTGTPGDRIAKAIVRECKMEDTVEPVHIARRKIQNYINRQHLVKEVKPVADIVREYYKMLPMAVGTGAHRVTALRTLEIIGLSDYFEHIVTADDVSKYKPDPETFLKCSELMKVDPADILVFEDGDFGIEAAKTAGMKAVDVRGWYEYSW
ncbi:MAG TPA: phosphatase [Bacteroidales bacterium]|nr:phosphatase [Bacteroidales bacterium]